MAKKPPPEGHASWPSYWSYKKEVARQYGPTPSGTYTVDIPGIKDIFRYETKKSYSRQYKSELYKRMTTRSSPVPQVFNWIPGIINKIDDAQDLLYVGFTLAKPLLRRLPSRFIPYIGWGLLIMDVMNIATKILGMAMTPGLTKPCIRKTVKKYRGLKKLPLEAFRTFMAPGGWRRGLAFWLQAPQAMVTLTGYGMQLGTIMGGVSDAIWGGIRALGGSKVTFRGPPPSDPAGKAARYLSQTHQTVNLRDILTPDEHVLLIMAHQIAVGIMLSEPLVWSDERISELNSTEVAVYEPWELSTLEMLEEVGHPLDEDIVSYTNIENPTYGDVFDDSLSRWYDWEIDIGQVMKEFSEEQNSVIWQIYAESAHDMIEAVTGVSYDDYTEDFQEIKTAYEMASYDLMPWRAPSEPEIKSYIDSATSIASARGASSPGHYEAGQAGTEIWGTMISKYRKIHMYDLKQEIDWQSSGGTRGKPAPISNYKHSEGTLK